MLAEASLFRFVRRQPHAWGIQGIESGPRTWAKASVWPGLRLP